MKVILRVEEAFQFALAFYFLYVLKVEWWFYVLLILGPDISMLGYLFGNKVGAFTYNIFHYKGVGISLLAFGLLNESWLLQVIGIIIFGHSAMDRMFGYGLKYFEGFHHTHLGIIGNKKNKLQEQNEHFEK